MRLCDLSLLNLSLNWTIAFGAEIDLLHCQVRLSYDSILGMNSFLFDQVLELITPCRIMSQKLVYHLFLVWSVLGCWEAEKLARHLLLLQLLRVSGLQLAVLSAPAEHLLPLLLLSTLHQVAFLQLLAPGLVIQTTIRLVAGLVDNVDGLGTRHHAVRLWKWLLRHFFLVFVLIVKNWWC